MPDARILVVDDSIVIRGLLSRIIDAEPGLEVASTAPDGRAGVMKVRSLDPDLVVLDVEMPVMTGLQALAEIRETHPKVPVIMFSTLTGQGASTTVEALSLGASDYALKPTTAGSDLNAIDQVRGELIAKIRSLVAATRRRPSTAGTTPTSAADSATPSVRRSSSRGRIHSIVIGCSTGGPVALEKVLTDVAAPFPVPVFVVQHMPPNFTKALAERLDRKTIHRVVEVDAATSVEPGTVHIAAGGRHMRLARKGPAVVALPDDSPPVNSCRPSVDPLFESAADVYGEGTLTVMLTGMGADGTDGTRRLAARGCDVIAQDEETCTVWGMPRSIVEAGLATEILPLDEIGRRIATIVQARADRRPALSGSTP